MTVPDRAGLTRRRFNERVLTALLTLAAPVAGVSCASAGASPAPTAASGGSRVPVVAAENFYGDLATQIGGDRVEVVSLLSDPNTDPHAYESNAEAARAVANARLVIKNGLGYDAFVDKLLAASPRPNRVVIDVGTLTGHQEGDNPHIWYDPKTMPRVADQLAATLTQLAPNGKASFAARLQAFAIAEKPVDERIGTIRAKYQGASVLATEPGFTYLAEALGLTIVDRDGAFQRAVEAGNDPPASAVARFRNLLTTRAVRVLIYNRQAITPITTQMEDLARQNGIPVVAVTETEPPDKTYQQWLLDELATLHQALGG
ncbi:MAG TPA: zinc ABC transporter substrate-binding protein [Chloroflexota bacterium]|nr:zinc ABC transporter substrate-binding protein [Chloroflexota bacterium]